MWCRICNKRFRLDKLPDENTIDNLCLDCMLKELDKHLDKLKEGEII